MGPVDAACDEYHYGPAGARYFAPNIWPDRLTTCPGSGKPTTVK